MQKEPAMKTISIEEFEKNFDKELEHVCKNNQPLHITRNNKKGAILLSKKDFQSLQETEYLMSNSRNFKAIQDGINQLGSDQSNEIDLEEL